MSTVQPGLGLLLPTSMLLTAPISEGLMGTSYSHPGPPLLHLETHRKMEDLVDPSSSTAGGAGCTAGQVSSAWQAGGISLRDTISNILE